MDSLKKQIGGDHYHNRTIQPIEYILANDMNFCEGCVIKYVTRWREKGGVEDLRKAMHYLQFLIEDQEQPPLDVNIPVNTNVGSVTNAAQKMEEYWKEIEGDDPGDTQPAHTGFSKVAGALDAARADRAISDPYPTNYKKYPDGH